MKRFNAWMLMAGLLGGFIVGCQEKVEEPLTQAPDQTEVLPVFPESQVPSPEPQPTTSPVAESYGPPVDTSVKAPAKKPAREVRQLPKESYAPVRKKATRTYVVRKGDTLQKISKRFYGTTKKWRKIYNANRNILAKGPDKVQIGMKLVIP